MISTLTLRLQSSKNTCIERVTDAIDVCIDPSSSCTSAMS